MKNDEIIRVVQLPIIEQYFNDLNQEISQRVQLALSLACTEETIGAVKKERAELNKMFAELAQRRKEVKEAVLTPYKRFEAVFNENVSAPMRAADDTLKRRINDIDAGVKKRCEEDLRQYFAEVCIVNRIDWLQYEDVGIKVDMASAKSKTPNKLRKEIKEFVETVRTNLDLISGMEHEEEILVEYKKCLNYANAVFIVKERHERIEQERKRQENDTAEKESVEKVVDKVEKVIALSPPKESEPQICCTFKVTDTKERLIALRNWMDENGYKFG